MEELATVSTRSGPPELQLARNVKRGKVEPAAGSISPFEKIMRDELKMSKEIVLGDKVHAPHGLGQSGLPKGKKEEARNGFHERSLSWKYELCWKPGSQGLLVTYVSL